MSNEFDLGLNIASIETELPDPVITLTGSDNLTASEMAEMPLLALTAYGRSWQGYASHGGEPMGKNLYEGSQDWSGEWENANKWTTLTETYNGLSIKSSSGAWGGLYKLIYVEAGKTYTFTCYAKSALGTAYVTIFAVYPTGTGDQIEESAMPPKVAAEPVTLGTEWTRLSVKYVCTASGYINPRIEKRNAEDTLYVCGYQLEESPEMTEYEPYMGNPNPDCPVPIKNIGDNGLTLTTCGKNLLINTAATKNINGVTFTVNNDYTVSAKGTAEDNALMTICPSFTFEAGVEYILSGTPKPVIGNVYIAVVNGEADFGNGAAIKYEQTTTTRIAVVVAKGRTVENAIFKPMLRLASVSDDTYEPYKSTTADITTALPLRGVPVSSGGNYTDANGQQWVCDTLEHVYGEPAQVTKRVEMAHFKSIMETHGCDAVMVVKNTADHFVYFGRYGRYFKNSTLRYYLYECLWEERYNVDTGELIYSIEGDGKNRVAEFAHRIYGKWTVEDTNEPVSFAEPLWELDNGKSIPAEYICETGTFVNGAEVIYPCESEILQLTTKETEALNALSGFTGSTKIYNDNTAEMTVKLLREDFEMQYIHWIKESQSFVCEKTGKYKIICVGGGSSGGVGAPETAETLQAAGTTTSFGNIISAEGGGKTKATLTALNFSEVVVGGQSGYDGINYGSTSHVMACDSSVHFTSAGGNSSVMWGTGHGYGAGGGARAYSSDLVAAGGRCGKVESTIVDLEENQIIACTIGGGGVLKLSDANVLDYLKTYVDKETTSASGMGEKVSACVSDGADGVIIIQYLGV